MTTATHLNRLGFMAAATLSALTTLSRGADTATERKISQNATGNASDIVLGFAVPQPADSKLPVAGFRKYERMVERLSDLAGNAVATRESIGKSRFNRDVWLLKISDANAIMDDGTPEPRVLITGGVHPREWIGPEVVLRLAEDLVGNFAAANDDRIEFLVNNCEIYIVPVINPDGFVYTQRFFDKFAEFEDGGTDFTSRDGRLRRKNLRDHSDQEFDAVGKRTTLTTPALTTFDGLLGVDLNRANKVGFGNPNGTIGTSLDPRAITYRGQAGDPYDLTKAEPELQNFDKLVKTTIGQDKLRGYIDYHSFGQYIVLPLAGDAARDQIAKDFRVLLRDAIEDKGGPAYSIAEALPNLRTIDVTQPAGRENGAVDELVANTSHKPLAFTVEMSPSFAGGGGNGFVLNPTQVVPVSNQNIFGAKLLPDFAIGPAYVKKVVIWADDDGDGKLDPTKELSYQAEWSGAGPRTLNVSLREWVRQETAKFLITFSEPMKLPNGAGDPVELDTTTAATDPVVKFKQKDKNNAMEHTAVKDGGWLKTKEMAAGGKITPGFAVYKFDTWSGKFEIPKNQSADFDGENVELIIDAQDLMNNKLDGDPKTVLDYNAKWLNYEDGAMPANANGGGVDKSHLFRIDSQPPKVRKKP